MQEMYDIPFLFITSIARKACDISLNKSSFQKCVISVQNKCRGKIEKIRRKKRYVKYVYLFLCKFVINVGFI